MTVDQAIKFLEDAAIYFDNKVLSTKEDKSYWAYVTNAEGCRQIADLIKGIRKHTMEECAQISINTGYFEGKIIADKIKDKM